MKKVLLVLFILSVGVAYGQSDSPKIKKNKEYTSGSGLKYIFFDIHENAPKADSGDIVYVHYIGKLANGTEFDQSYSRNEPIKFTLGIGRVIKGWDEGIQLMHVGDSALFMIPPEIAYGARSVGSIPANSSLFFTVKLVKVEKPKPIIDHSVKPYDVTGLDTISLDSGLQYIRVVKGKGKKAKNGDRVYVHYTGYLTNGKKFDASYNRNVPLAMVLGRHQVIKGWEMGILGMKVGEKRRLLIPYPLAYGERGHPPVIPSKSDLVFDVELMKITPHAIPDPYNVKKKDTITTESGLKYIMVKQTEGDSALVGDTVVVKYVAYFEDGKILESTYERGDSLRVVAGSMTMIPGIIEAVSILKVGEKARFIIPYQIGFGEAGRPPMIPAKSTLIFDLYSQNILKGK